MIDDNQAARPQSGFTSASIVYQAPADGGEVRYMMVFQEGTATDIGPVRSMRPYYAYWAAEYKASFGHYGGDAQSLSEVIPAMASYIYNMDALRGQPCAYHRVSTRVMPHNAYTNSAAQIGCAKKYRLPGGRTRGCPRARSSTTCRPAFRPEKASISIAYPTGTIDYKYDKKSNSYLRSVHGKAQIDPASKKRVTARDVVVLIQNVSYYSEPGHGSRPVVANVGTGKAIVFHDGLAIVGTWKKTTNTDLTRLYDSYGDEIPLLRGEIFIQSVPPKYKVAYS